MILEHPGVLEGAPGTVKGADGPYPEQLPWALEAWGRLIHFLFQNIFHVKSNPLRYIENLLNC